MSNFIKRYAQEIAIISIMGVCAVMLYDLGSSSSEKPPVADAGTPLQEAGCE